ncbi:hypothetical protein ACFXA2_04510 [Micromonospora chalcea]
MAVTAAGVFRRTPQERADQRLAWERADQPFFAAGACHILAWDTSGRPAPPPSGRARPWHRLGGCRCAAVSA